MNYTPILRYLREAAQKDPAVRTYGTKDPLKRHRESCLGLSPLATMTGGVDGSVTPPPPPEEGAITDEQIRNEARRLLHGRLNELGAKELHSLVIEGLKLARAETAARKKDDDESETDDDAVADLGALRAVE